MSDADERRSAQARALAERALVLLMTEIGDDDVPLIVLGSLVPEVLTRDTGAGTRSTSEQRTSMSCCSRTSMQGRISAASSARSSASTSRLTLMAWRWRGPIDGRPAKTSFCATWTTAPKARSSVPPAASTWLQ